MWHRNIILGVLIAWRADNGHVRFNPTQGADRVRDQSSCTPLGLKERVDGTALDEVAGDACDYSEPIDMHVAACSRNYTHASQKPIQDSDSVAPPLQNITQRHACVEVFPPFHETHLSNKPS